MRLPLSLNVLKALLALMLLIAAHAQAIDLQPGDVVAPKPGYSSLNVAFQYSEKSDFYKNGQKQSAYPQISSSLYTARIGRSFELADHPAYFTPNCQWALFIHKVMPVMRG